MPDETLGGASAQRRGPGDTARKGNAAPLEARSPADNDAVMAEVDGITAELARNGRVDPENVGKCQPARRVGRCGRARPRLTVLG